MAKIEDHKYTIEEAFRECFYVVPDYQREYVWTEKEVQQLLQDIDEEFDVGDRREYFIGTVLVSPTTQKGHFEVIDGQQRLTTFFLLLCALRQRFKANRNIRILPACWRRATPTPAAISRPASSLSRVTSTQAS
ncbi:DUF262 domain-containing protein [Bradyrhizobium japonicum]|uniref:DUF262 domain-containing protein n=1 Tax=Bradyrhizobium japonicum TaxID=375 RepID=UPI001BA772F7|nr:DUF262 domain-containing protein [Bradyrhizobium japonicum]MBR0758996.1 DUF262 domain-containing protein [Bradyrhizobium japonicum]